MYQSQSPPRSPVSPISGCPSKHALLRGLQPNSQAQKYHCVCPTRCIFCDIWKLAELVYTRIPASLTSSSSTSIRSSSSSSSYANELDWEKREKAIETAFHTQRARLASIISICIVDGAEESEGLRIAHDRCRESVIGLLEQERRLHERVARASTPTIRRDHRTVTRDCGSQQQQQQWGMDEGRRGSMVGLAR